VTWRIGKDARKRKEKQMQGEMNAREWNEWRELIVENKKY